MDDKSTTLSPIIGNATLPYRGDLGAMMSLEQITSFQSSAELKTDAVVARQYDFEKPALDAVGTAPAGHVSGYDMQFYDPAVYLPRPLDIPNFAKLRLEQYRTLGRSANGTSGCARLAPGGTFNLADHTVEALNATYLIVHVDHRGVDPMMAEDAASEHDEAPYSNRFLCAPAEDPYRPSLKTPKPRVQGPQPAVVVGPSSEEIYTDQYGRVKVQFYWDRIGKKNENSSCWVRVSQTYAGEGWGSMQLPRVKQEVVVDFIEGDPDAPIIVGRLYHGTNVVPYTLPDNRTVTTLKSNSSPGGGGSNELRFEDKKGEEEVYVHAQKDLVGVVENDRTETVGQDESWHVKRDRTDTVDRDETTHIGRDRKETVDRNETIEITKARKLSVGDDDTETISGNHSLTVSKGSTVSVSKDTSVSLDSKLDVTTGAKMTLTVNADLATTVSSNSDENISLKKTITAGTEVTITCGGGTIKIGAAGDITVSGLQVKISGDAKLDVTSPITTLGDTMTTVKGQLVQITGSMIQIG